MTVADPGTGTEPSSFVGNRRGGGAAAAGESLAPAGSSPGRADHHLGRQLADDEAGARRGAAWTFRSLCLMIGGGALLILARAAGTPMGVPRRLLPALALVSLFNITGWHLFSAYALLHTGSGRAAIIGYTMPLWASLLSIWVLDIRPTARQVAALLLGMAALALLMVKDFGALGAAPTGRC